MDRLLDYLVMAKPAGARCNLDCAYCYYLAKAGLFPGAPPRLPEDLLEEYIRQRLEGPGPATHFEWHGGEPTLLGLDYFRRIVALQQAHRPPGRAVSNGLQTNGTLLDPSWARFLAREAFSVGLSLDGPAACHDAYRLTRDGQGSHAGAVRGFRLLKSHGVHVDALCVLHAANTGSPLQVYQYFRDLGVTHLQFLPLTRSSAAAAPGAIGEFLCSVFDQWLRNDLGRVTVQNFDEAFRTACGLPHALCLFRETCGDVLVLEHEGSVFACDHFVDPEHRLGNLRQETLAAMAAGPALAEFGRRKRDGLPGRCRACDVLAWCNGGCPKDRVLTEPSGEPGVNLLCPDYRRFFRHCKPVLKRLAAHWKAGRPLRDFARPAAARGKDPCPCGSGQAFKRCCRR
jgi:uncharacterized protein